MSETPVAAVAGIKHLWASQDEALRQNLGQSAKLREALGALDGAVSLTLKIMGKTRFPAEKQTAIRVLTVDSLSHVVIAARVGLWGAASESLSILRGAVESCAQLSYTVFKQRYQIAISEISSRRLRELEFRACCDAIGPAGSSLKKLHGRLSNTAAHSTPGRLRRSEYEIRGEDYDRLGFAIDPETAEATTLSCLQLVPSIGMCLWEAWKQDQLEFPQEWSGAIYATRQLYENLSRRAVAGN
jgi:hypothetical protein